MKKNKGTDYVLSWKSKAVDNSRLKLLYTAFFLHNIKLSGYKMGIKSGKDLLAVEENNYLTKTIYIYIVYGLNFGPKNPTNIFKFENCLFGATSVVKNSDKEKYVYSGCGITFDSANSWSHDNNLLEML